MVTTNLDRLLTILGIHLHAASVCTIGEGWRLAFDSFEAVTVHHVLSGCGAVWVGNGPPLPCAPGSIIVVPSRQPHAIGNAGPAAAEARAEEHCGPFVDGLLAFTAGGSPGTLLLCGSIPAPHGGVLGLFDLVREPIVETVGGDVVRHAFDHMRAEIAAPGLGTAAMTEALMKVCLVALLRGQLSREGLASPSFALSGDPRLARAVIAVLEHPGAPHTVASLAERAGMSRASFADHFSQAFEGGPMEFVQKVRLRATARLLVTTDLPLKVIAAGVGYADPTSLSRAFRGAYGIDPTRYRGLDGNAGLVQAPRSETSVGGAARPTGEEEPTG